jgi:hypothetical protein
MRNKIVYPRSLKDIPRWRQRQLAEDIRWFSQYSPTQRLNHMDREWREAQEFIARFGLIKHGTAKGNRSL